MTAMLEEVNAVLMSSDLQGSWLSLNDLNSGNPDTGAGTKWVPQYSYGAAAITGLTNANVTLTPAQAMKKRIALADTLTANVQIIFPAWVGEWIVVNNTSGSFTVTAKTASGSGVLLLPGSKRSLATARTSFNRVRASRPPRSVHSRQRLHRFRRC
ncbi:hypothetical protein [Paraburkholderia bannensis]|uniref:hypothetical protein n=1 Tax=Paraburkholderia bannensis TaxID=765414 RepID=UPI002AC327AA|nr:hypothetical protein [Paraburkholderia bannensis]